MNPIPSRRPLSPLLLPALAMSLAGLLLHARPFGRVAESPRDSYAAGVLVLAGLVLTLLALVRAFRKKKARLGTVVACLLSLVSAGTVLLSGLPPSHEALPVGAAAPDFSLPAGDGTTFRLSEHRGKKVLLSFFRGSW